ncbi:hypothetical protein NL676_018531 [Syzygium grande]|nr:hypothetical protein NL676_018531 [Syzygium grande]
MAGSSALLTVTTTAVLLVGLAVASSPAHAPSKSPSPKASPSPSSIAATAPLAYAPSPHDPAAYPRRPHPRRRLPRSRPPVTRGDVAGGTKREDVGADPPSDRVGIGGQRRYVAISCRNHNPSAGVRRRLDYHRIGAVYSDLPDCRRPQEPHRGLPNLDSMSKKLRHPFLTRLDSLDKSDEIQLKSCKFRYSASEEST